MNIPSGIRPILAAVALMFAAMPAWAQVESREGIALQNQILDLQRQVQGMQAQAGRGSPTNLGGGYSGPPPSTSSGDLVAQLLSRVGALEDQVRQLRGRVDELQNQADRQSADLAKKIDDLAFQMQNPGAAAPPRTGPVPRPAQSQTISPQPGALSLAAPQPMQPQAPQPPPAPIKRTPELSMQEGNAALARRDYTAAEQAAREVLINYRTSPRAYDAQFLLAQALTGQRQFSQAAIAYDDTYNRSRRGGHAEDALLGLANSLAAINEKKAACDTLGKLRAEFPTLRPDLRDGVASAAQRSGCR
ncbi:MAG TPA: tetratricopeptide repeat protein [Acetobacteraceae bacterium]|jgi:TolA-binding protein|nr:tetratricopeptide repeat protein [Acetobacteraceae bacterium]